MADPSTLSQWQGPMQAFLRPAIWIPGYRNIRFHKETWESDDLTSRVFDALVEVFTEFRSNRSLLGASVVLHTVNKNTQFIEVHTYTPGAEWLDVVDVNLRPRSKGCVIEIRSWSSGFLPTIVPLAPLLNLALFWVPFSGRDANGWVNSRRVHTIQDSLQKKVSLRPVS